MLRNGSSGEAVEALQQKLAGKGFDPGAADGIFGPRTEAALRQYQESIGLDVDGIAGPKTLFTLGISAADADEGVEAAADDGDDDGPIRS